MAMDREAFFISKLSQSGVTLKLNDDGILLNRSIYAMDLFVEGVHFTRQHFSLYQIAQKAMLVNISDILAMGVKPQFALLGISFSKDMTNGDILELQRGIIAACREFGIKIIGGDTIKDTKLSIAITLFGGIKACGTDFVKDSCKKFVKNSPKIPQKKYHNGIISRANFKQGDLLYHTGFLGSVERDMRYLYRGGKISPKSRFFLPQLRAKFIAKILRFVGGGMDISDGLFYELNRISRANSIAFSFTRPINRRNATSGEEYELLFSIKPRDSKRLEKVAKLTRTKITQIAKIKRGRVHFHCRGHHG